MLKTLMPLILVLAGGVISLASSFVVGWRLHVFGRQAVREEKRKEKLERFATLAREIQGMPFRMPQVSAEEVKLTWLGMTEELSDIALIYLPELMSAAAIITTASQKFLQAAEIVIEGAEDEDGLDQMKRTFMRKQKLMSEAWETAMEDITELAERFRMSEGFKPLSSQTKGMEQLKD